MAQTWASKDAIESEVLICHFPILEVLAANPAPFDLAKRALHAVLGSLSS